MNYDELFRGMATLGAGTLFAILFYKDHFFPKKSEKEKQREKVRRKIERAKRLKPIRKMNKFDRSIFLRTFSRCFSFSDFFGKK